MRRILCLVNEDGVERVLLGLTCMLYNQCESSVFPFYRFWDGTPHPQMQWGLLSNAWLVQNCAFPAWEEGQIGLRGVIEGGYSEETSW